MFFPSKNVLSCNCFPAREIILSSFSTQVFCNEIRRLEVNYVRRHERREWFLLSAKSASKNSVKKCKQSKAGLTWQSDLFFLGNSRRSGKIFTTRSDCNRDRIVYHPAMTPIRISRIVQGRLVHDVEDCSEELPIIGPFRAWKPTIIMP